MKFKKITALLSATVMAFSLASTVSAGVVGNWNIDLDSQKLETVNPIKVDLSLDVKSSDEAVYADSVKFAEGKTYDFKAILDMTKVEEMFDAAVDILAAQGIDSATFNAREIKGEFVVAIQPDGTYVSVPDEIKAKDGMYGFTLSEAQKAIYEEVKREMDGNDLKITVKIKDGVTVGQVKAEGFENISYEVTGVDVEKSSSTITVAGKIDGEIKIVSPADVTKNNVYAEFTADDTTTIRPITTGGLGGGGTSTPAKKKATVTFYDGTKEYLKETVDITDGAYTFNVAAVEAPETTENKIFAGWFEDKECTVKASDKKSITANTSFYAGWIDTKYGVTFMIDGKLAAVNKGAAGSVIVKNGDILVEEDGVLIKLSELTAQGLKILGWYLDPEYTIPADGEVKITEDTVFYAVTEEITVPGELEKDDHFAYIIGYPEGDVRPENPITREEVATIFFRLLTEEARNANKTSVNDFADVEEARWSNNAISTMAKLGIITGYEDGTFKPDQKITRAEFATIAARFEDEVEAGSASFTDIAGHWAEDYIKEAAALQWINGYEDGSFRPDNKITRAEVMAIVNRMLQRKVSAENILPTATFWTDNSEAAWYYEDVMEATNSHTYERVAEGQIEERWVEIQANRDWSELEK